MKGSLRGPSKNIVNEGEKSMENEIRKNLMKHGLSNAEASREAFGYLVAWERGEVAPETMADLLGVSVAELPRIDG